MKKWIVIALVVVLLVSLAPQAIAVVPPSITVGVWRIQFRADHAHSFGGCVKVPVNHVHFEVFRGIGKGRFKYIVNLHIGYYVAGNKRCWVVWNNTQPTVCSKSCTGGQTGLRTVIKTGLIVVGVATAVATALAASAAPIVMRMIP